MKEIESRGRYRLCGLMSISFQTTDSVAGPLDLITDDDSGLRLTVCRTGAEPVSLALREASGAWRGFLWRDGQVEKPASGWGNHATVMGYFVHRLWKQESVYEGHVIKGGNHGFLRSFAFDAPEVDLTAGTLTYSVEPERIPPGAYPYRVALKLTYSVSGGVFRMTFRFENREDHDVALGFGWHPGFAVGDLGSARLLMPGGTYRRQMAPGDFLDGTEQEIRFQGGEMPFAKQDLPGSYLLDLSEVPGRTFVLESPALGQRVVCDYAEAPYLTLWSNGDPFLCVEPCWGLPDNNPPVPFEQKKGIRHIAPRGRLEASLTVTPSFFS
jgi:galactose mutarotase-like enzyme